MKKLIVGLFSAILVPCLYAVLPDGYLQLDYVESDGGQWVDVGLKLKNTYQVEIDFQPKSLEKSTLVFGARDSATSKNFASCWDSTNGLCADFDNYKNTRLTYKISVGTRYYLTVNKSSRELRSGGSSGRVVETQSTSSATVFETPGNCYLLSMNRPSTQLTSYVNFTGLLYCFKITDLSSNKVLRDLVPCRRSSDGVAGLFDLQGNEFYVSEGTKFGGPISPMTIEAPVGSEVRQAGVTDVALTVSGKGTVRMTGSNIFGTVNMSRMAGSSTSDLGGTLFFGSVDGSQVENIIRAGGLDVPAYSTLVFSNSVTTIANALQGNRSGNMIVKDGLITVGDVVTCNKNTADVQWDDSPWLVFDGCTANLNKGLINCNNGKFGHIVVTNDAQVTVAGGKVDFTAGDIYLSGANSKLSGTYNQYTFVLGGLLRTRLFQSGGTFSVGSSYGNGVIGNKTEADIYLSGGVFQINNSTDIGGGSASGEGYVYQTGGTFQLGGDAYKTLTIGKVGKGYYEISGGTLSYNDKQKDLNIAEAGSVGELRILGGVVKARKLVGRGGNSTVTFNGGEWQPTEATITDSLTTLQMGSKGGVISNTTTDQTLSQSISDWAEQTTGAIEPARYLSVGAFSVNKKGRTLTLSAPSTYSCATEVAQGTLKVASDDVLPSTTVLRINAGATLDLNNTTQHVTGLCGAGTVKNGTLIVSGYVMPGLGDEGGTLTFSNATVISDGFAMYLKEDGAATGDINGALTLTEGAKVTAVNPENIKDKQAVLTLGDGCTLSASTVISTLERYIAKVSDKSIGLGKPGLIVVFK